MSSVSTGLHVGSALVNPGSSERGEEPLLHFTPVSWLPLHRQPSHPHNREDTSSCLSILSCPRPLAPAPQPVSQCYPLHHSHRHFLLHLLTVWGPPLLFSDHPDPQWSQWSVYSPCCSTAQNALIALVALKLKPHPPHSSVGQIRRMVQGLPPQAQVLLLRTCT